MHAPPLQLVSQKDGALTRAEVLVIGVSCCHHDCMVPLTDLLQLLSGIQRQANARHTKLGKVSVFAQVAAILVLYGLPWLLTGTILAHECMHAWLRLRGITQLPLQTEEGLCQLMGLLWLESQDLSKQQVSNCTNDTHWHVALQFDVVSTLCIYDAALKLLCNCCNAWSLTGKLASIKCLARQQGGSSDDCTYVGGMGGEARQLLCSSDPDRSNISVWRWVQAGTGSISGV